jgi:hypothetical protein
MDLVLVGLIGNAPGTAYLVDRDSSGGDGMEDVVDSLRDGAKLLVGGTFASEYTL